MRKYFFAVSLFAPVLLASMTACGGGGSAPIAVSITTPASTSIAAGGSTALTAGVRNDSKNAGVTWSLSPATGCGSLSNVTTTSATYTAPAAATLDTNCTATITATSVSNTSKISTVVLTADAITVTASSSSGSTTTFGEGATAVTLTATLGNEAPGANDSVTWSLASAPASSIRTGSSRRQTRTRADSVTQLACGTLVQSTTNPEQATWTPPTSMAANCTATISAASTINSNQKWTTEFTADAIVLAITAPAGAVTEYADKGAVNLNATIANDGANKGVTWALTAGSCGAIAQAGTTAIYNPPTSPAAQCTATATVASVTDPTKTETAPIITINPNIAVGFATAPPASLNEGAAQALTAKITNDLSNGGASWSLSPVTGCGSLSASSGMTVTYTAGTPMTAACTATVTTASATDSTQSASANIAVQPTAVNITAPASAQSVDSGTTTAVTASISDDGSGKGIAWTITPVAPATSCGSLGAATVNNGVSTVNYMAPADKALGGAACTAAITAASYYDALKSKSVNITANPITMSAITSTSMTLPATVLESAASIPLAATIGYDPGGGIAWSVSPATCGSMSTAAPTVSGSTSTTAFTPAASVAGMSNCVATITAASVADTGRASTATITVVPIWVNVSAQKSALVEGETDTLTATTNDPAGAAKLTWSMSGCGSLQTNVGGSVVYNTPDPMTGSGCTATVTAGSKTDSSKSANVNISVNQITVGTTPGGTLTLVEGTPQPVTATTNDPVGVSWTSTGCGSLTSTASGVTYNTPIPPMTASCAATVTATSKTDGTLTATVKITVNPISVSITSPSGSQNTQSSGPQITVQATTTDSAGAATLNWSVTPPTGCGTLSAWTGASVNYTPPALLAAQCTVAVTAASKTDPAHTNGLSITVNPAPITVAVTSPTTSSAPVGVGGTLAVTATVTDDATGKGIGYALNPNTCGKFSWTTSSTTGGTSTYMGTYTAPTTACQTTLVLDANAATSQTATLNINVTAAPTVALSAIVGTEPPAGPISMDANSPLSVTATVNNGGTNPSVNLTLNPPTGCGSLSASSAASGAPFSYNPPVGLTNSCTANIVATYPVTSASASLSLTVYPALTLPPSTTSLPVATAGDYYKAMLDTGGGPLSGTYLWSATWLTTADSLGFNAPAPVGSLGISGTPTAGWSGTLKLQVSVTDPNGTTVGPVTYTITVNPYIMVSLPSETLPTGYVSQGYNAGINASGGVMNYTYTVTVNGTSTTIGSNPTAISDADGLTGACSGGNTLFLSGTPTSATTTGSPITLNVSVVDGEGKSASNIYTLNVTNQPPLSITASNMQIQQGMVNMPYGMNVNSGNNGSPINGGTPPYSYSYVGLPTWASYDQNGNITGTPNAEYASSNGPNVTLTVKDSSQPVQTALASFALPVVPETVGSNNSLLKGQYACYFHQEFDYPTVVNGNNLYVGAGAFAFTSDGNGNITGGEADSNNPIKGYQFMPSLTGSYAVGSDNRGFLTISPGWYWALAAGTTDSKGYYQQFRFTNMSDVGISSNGWHGGGRCFKQYYETGTTTLLGENLSGGYVMALNGESGGGNWETMVGSMSISAAPSGGCANGAVAPSSCLTGVLDTAAGTQVNQDVAFSGSITPADAYGRVLVTAGPAGQTANQSAVYITNQSSGQGAIVGMNTHTGVNDNDLQFGQIRAQNAAQIDVAFPLTGPVVVYGTGLDTGGAGDYKASAFHGTPNPASSTITLDATIDNENGTLKINHDTGTSAVLTYDSTTGRGSVGSGDTFYFYGTGAAVFMFADIGHGGGTTPQNMLGWMQPQAGPANSGAWTFADMATNYLMGDMYNPDSSRGSDTGTFSIDSSGNFYNFAQDKGAQNWADWDEGISGGSGGTATGVLVPDTTLDPNGTFGVFDINITQGGTTSTQVYCFAIDVDHATNSDTKGQVICLDASSPKVTIVQE